jgi:hypothetical protein
MIGIIVLAISVIVLGLAAFRRGVDSRDVGRI